MFHFHTLNKLHAGTDSSKVSFSSSVAPYCLPACLRPLSCPSTVLSSCFACSLSLSLSTSFLPVCCHAPRAVRQPSHSSHLLPVLLLLLLLLLLHILLLLLLYLALPANFTTNSCPQYASAPLFAHSFSSSMVTLEPLSNKVTKAEAMRSSVFFGLVLKLQMQFTSLGR